MFPGNTRILIVDDMMMMRKVVKKTLQDLGFSDIQEAADGGQGWEILQKSDPAIGLVISDWNMPNLTGVELLKKVRADQKLGKIPFILLTAEAEAHQVKEAMAAGVSNYIAKPFTPDTIKEKLEHTHKRLAGG